MSKPIWTITRVTLDAAQLRKSQGHKYNHGHALVLSGGAGRTGAARLAARGALRIGAGAVTLGTPPNAQLEIAGHITALMLQRIADTDALKDSLGDGRINALCIGPGFGLERCQQDILRCVLESRRPCVIDADAITLLAHDPGLAAMLHSGCVLTPHFGEFQRLFPDIGAASPEDLARDAAARCSATIVLKGPRTAIASADGSCAVHCAEGARAVPWLATAGAGDVLAGYITGLMARGFAPLDAACYAAWLHVECAVSFGPGLIAEDLPEELPKVLKALDA